MPKKYLLPTEFQAKIQKALESVQFSLEEPHKLAKAVMHLSDHYQQKKQTTPWNDPQGLAAGLAYYLPLNFIRNRKVFDEVQRLGFAKDSSYFLDYGMGLGPSYWAAQEAGLEFSNENYFGFDASSKPLQILDVYFGQKVNSHWKSTWAPQTCGIFSYSLNELGTLPPWFFELQNIVILEPSTGDKGRALMELRSSLILKGYSIWAPCTHHEACPLLTQSKKDWCHDRVHWEQPEWFAKIEKLLPIKNKTLTHSYLLASKTSAPRTPHMGRIVGDELKEKGKTRWLYCRNSEREFLSWLDKQGPAPDWHRGDLQVLEKFEKKGNELRLPKENHS